MSIEEIKTRDVMKKKSTEANNETKKALEQGLEEETMLFEDMVPVSILPQTDSSEHLENEEENDASMISIESGVFDEVVMVNKKPVKRELITRSQDSEEPDESVTVQSVLYK